MNPKLPIACILSIVTLALPAQDRFAGFIAPQALLNGKFHDQWQWNLTLAPEFRWLEKNEGSPADRAFRTNVVNLQSGLAFQWTNDLNISLGYQLNFRDLDEEETDLEHRFLEQLSYTERLGKYRLRGRLRAEQRFFRKQDFQVVHRWRLRAAVDVPLQGERLDIRETYLHANAEWLVNLSSNRPLYFSEYRLYTGIGWQIGEKQRLETGPELRTRLLNMQRDKTRVLFWRLAVFLN